MYIQPKSLLSRLIGAAWTIFFAAVLIWLAVHLLGDVLIWIVAIALLVLAVRAAFWWRQLRRDYW